MENHPLIDQIFLGDDSLPVVDGIQTGYFEIGEEVADSGPVVQDVKDQRVYDDSPLDSALINFIKDLQEDSHEEDEEEKDDVTFDTTKEVLNILDETLREQNEVTVHQKDLDHRLNLEDSLIGEFDCFKS